MDEDRPMEILRPPSIAEDDVRRVFGVSGANLLLTVPDHCIPLRNYIMGGRHASV